jgi:hypothetical protein
MTSPRREMMGDQALPSGRRHPLRFSAAQMNTIRRFGPRGLFALVIVAGPIMAIAAVASASSTARDASMPVKNTDNNCQAESSPCATIACTQPQTVWRDSLGDGARNQTTYVDWTAQALHRQSVDTTILEPLSTIEAIASTNPCDLILRRINKAGSGLTRVSMPVSGTSDR